ncbi:MAG TPA: adenylate/guanylate cyclase domain-containing protein [Nitrososphaerales archaeon]|nr:adenylate/guanylate cyclase domain-containing protein [Nitrososphaerales archaeon]
MSEEERRLAAIMFTDMVGYTSLTQSDEDQALKVLERHNELIRPFFQKRKGREIKTIGDSFLVEFESTLDAVKCAIEIQEFLHQYNLSLREETKIRLRIGIHVGDVVHKAGDVLGDAVNIASRIQPLADVDGVCLTRQAFDHVQNKIRIPMMSMGSISLKNVNQAIEIYKIMMPWNQEGTPLSSLYDDKRIAVLPFVNMSPDPNDEYFADGLTEELIDKLSQVKGLEVIARTSAMSYKNKGKKISEIGKELRVGTLIEGSVRKVGNKIRVTVDLIDGNTESHLWSSRYNKDLDDIFSIQSDIASNVTGSIPATLGLESRSVLEEKETENILAYTYFLQARELLHETAQAAIRDALDLFERAIKRDPNFAKAYVGQALCYRSLATYGHIPFQQAIESAKISIGKALVIKDTLAEAHSTLAAVELMEDNLRAAEIEVRRAIELNPNLADAYSNLASIVGGQGDLNESIKLREKAYRLDPLEPWNVTTLGDEYFWAGRESEALNIWETSVKFAPYMTYDSMMDYYINKGQYEKAANTIQILRKLDSDNAENDFWEGYLAAVKGEREKAAQVIKVLEKSSMEGAVTINGIGLIYCALGDLDSFFEQMRKSIESHTIALEVLKYSPLAAKARADPRSQELFEMYERMYRQKTHL